MSCTRINFTFLDMWGVANGFLNIRYNYKKICLYKCILYQVLSSFVLIRVLGYIWLSFFSPFILINQELKLGGYTRSLWTLVSWSVKERPTPLSLRVFVRMTYDNMQQSDCMILVQDGCPNHCPFPPPSFFLACLLCSLPSSLIPFRQWNKS